MLRIKAGATVTIGNVYPDIFKPFSQKWQEASAHSEVGQSTMVTAPKAGIKVMVTNTKPPVNVISLPGM